MTVVCYDARFCVAACVSKGVGVIRRKILRRCVCSKEVVCYDARFCVAACVSKTGWCITMQRFCIAVCVQKGWLYYDADFASLCRSKRGGVLRRKILRRCVCFKGVGYYDARFLRRCFLNDRSYLVSFFSQQFDDAFSPPRWPAPTAKGGFCLARVMICGIHLCSCH